MTRTGHTRITRTALRHTIETVTAHAFGVTRRNVTAELEDDGGRLAAAVTVQLVLPPLLGPRPDTGSATVYDRSREARGAIINRGQELTGMSLSRVDIRLSGTKPQDQHRERRVA